MEIVRHYPAPDPLTGDLPLFTGRVRGSSLVASGFSWTELVASTSEAWGGFMIQLMRLNSIGFGVVAVGPVGGETIIANFHAYGVGQKCEVYLPIPIPAGSRISFSVAGATTETGYAQIIGFPVSGFASLSGLSKCECGPFDLGGLSATYGQGSFIDPPATANTKSAWTEASRLEHSGNILQGNSLPYQYKYLGFGFWSAPSASGTDQWKGIVDVARGSVGAEVPLIENLAIRAAPGNSLINMPHIIWVPWNRPAGDRISWRMQFSTTTAKRVNLFLYGLR